MNANPKVTIVTPSYNQGQFIEATILSVLNQTYPNIEYILVDGGSTDETMEIVNRYKDRIDLIISEKDKGQSDAINKGFKSATGELAGWINSDDILYPDCVEKIVELYLNHPGGSIYAPDSLDRINTQGKFIKKFTYRTTDKNYLLNTNYSVVQQGSFYDCKALEQVGYVDENIYYCMDLDLWLRLLDVGKIYSYKEKSLAAYRAWEGTKTHQGGEKFSDNIIEILNKHGADFFSKTKLHLFFIRCRMRGGKLKRFLLKQRGLRQ